MAASETIKKIWKLFYLHVVDHGLLRLFYSNFHRLPGGLYRSNQPSPSKLRWYHQKYGIRTVINLRGGDSDNPSWQLEKEMCDQLGVKLVDLKLFSRSYPYPEDIRLVKETVLMIEYPALVHCKSGADRAGLFSVLYRIFRIGEPVEKAVSELGLRYGHLKWARTGTLDQFFIEYQKYRELNNSCLSLEDWVDNHYDREYLKSLRPERGMGERFGNFLTDTVLRRE